MEGMKVPAHESKEKPPEMVDLYDENNEPLGKAVSRDQAHAEGLWHRTVHIYLTRSTESGLEILVHLRSKRKKQYANTLDPVFGGHVQAGTTVEDTAASELEEETGIVPEAQKLLFHGFIKKDDEENAPGDKEFNMIFSYELSEEEQKKIILQEEEVESVEWVPLAELATRVTNSKDGWRPSVQEVTNSLNVLLNKE